MKLAVLLSGRGSNFEAIASAVARGELKATIEVVVSNRPDAPGLARAEGAGIPAIALDHKLYPSREAHESAVLDAIARYQPDFIVLAGYMRRLSPRFLAGYPQRIVNIHPSLLPSFPGVDAQRQALEYGVRVSGCTVHLVEEVVDGGAILVQRVVPVLTDDTPETLSARILVEEHIAYVEALTLLEKGFRVEGRRVLPAN